MTWRYALSDLVIPPLGCAWLALAALVAAAFLGRRWRPWALGVAFGAIALMLVLSMPVIETRLLDSLGTGLPTAPPANAPPQAIVILSAEGARTAEGPDVGQLTLQRLLAGVRLYHRTRLPILVSGGVVEKDSPSIASLMARVLEQDFNAPVRWVEGRSETTWENAKDSAAILLPLGIRSVYVVTSAWHERRAMLAFRHFGLVPTAAPVPSDLPQNQFIPTATGFYRSFYALHEWLGLLAYDIQARLSGAPKPIAPFSPANKAA